jgi:hypothetical protein
MYNEHIKATRRAAFICFNPGAFPKTPEAAMIQASGQPWQENTAQTVHAAIVDSLRQDRKTSWQALFAHCNQVVERYSK